MTINFIVAGTKISGGNKAIFEIANQLVKKSHIVNVICPKTPFFLEGKWFNPHDLTTKFLRTFRKTKECIYPIKWFDLKANFLPVISLREKNIPNADATIATWWQTAYAVSRYSQSKGAKIYFVQDYEIWGGHKKLVGKTYKMGMVNIVNSTWLKNILEDLGAPVEKVILHAPVHEQFGKTKIKREKDYFRILIPYRADERKGMKNGLLAIGAVQKKYSNIKIVLFGAKPENKNIFKGLKNLEFHIFPVKDDLKKLYNSCDVFVYPTIEEAFGMPPMEAMVCGLPVVATTAGAIPEYSVDKKTVLLSAPGDIEKMKKNIIKLIENPDLRKRLATNAKKHIAQFTWEKSAGELEKIFMKYVKDT